MPERFAFRLDAAGVGQKFQREVAHRYNRLTKRMPWRLAPLVRSERPAVVVQGQRAAGERI